MNIGKKSASIRVLLIDDNLEDAAKIKDVLDNAKLHYEGFSDLSLAHVDSLEQGLEILSDQQVDLTLLNPTLQDGHNLGALTSVLSIAPQVPLIALIDGGDQTLALEAVRAGAQDALFREALDEPGLVSSIHYAIERKGTELALERSEANYRSLVETTAAGIAATDAKGKLAFVNKRLCNMTGYSAEELLNEPFAEFLHPDDLPKMLKLFLSAHQNPDQRPQVDFRIIHKEGHAIHCFSSPTILAYRGEIKGFNAIILDVSERKQAEMELRESNERFLTILNSIDAHIYAADMETYEIIFMNKNMQDGFGGNLSGKICWEVFRGGTTQCGHCSNYKLVDHNGNPTGVHIWEGDNPVTGRWYNNYDRAVQWVDGRIVRLQIATDITDRKLAEESLRQERDKAQKYLNIAGVMFVAIDSNGDVTLINQKGSEILGYEQEEIVGKNWFDTFIPENNKKQTRTVFNKLITGEIEPDEFHENRVVTKNGEERIIAWHNTILKDGEDKIIGTLSSGDDITEQVLAEEALAKSESRYRVVSELVSDFAYAFRVESDGNLTREWVTEALERISSWTADELEERGGWQALIHPDDMHVPMSQYHALMEGKSEIVEYRILTKDGETKWVRDYAKPVWDEEQERVTHIYGAVQEITSRKQDEDTLKQRHREITTLFEATTAISSSLSLDSVLQTVADQMTQVSDAAGCTLSLWDRENNLIRTLVDYRAAGPDGTEPPGTSYELMNYPLTQQVLDSYTPEVIHSNFQSSDTAELILMRQQGIGILLMLPLVCHDHVLGLVELYEEKETTRQEYTKDEIRFLQSLAAQAAVAMENARLFEETKCRANEFSSLYEIARDLSAKTKLENLLQTILERAASLFGVPGSGIYIYDPLREDLEVVAALESSIQIGTKLALGEGMAGRVAQNRNPLIVSDYRTWEHRARAYEGKPFTSCLEVPMLYGGDLIGVLAVHDTVPENPMVPIREFTEMDANLLTLLASSAAGAVYSVRLHEQTVQDAKQLNRRMEQLIALQKIDTVITGSSDLKFSLRTVLVTIKEQLGVDAVTVLLIDPITHRLKSTAGIGFRTDTVNRSPIRFGEGLAGRVAHEGKTIQIPNLSATSAAISRTDLLIKENFHAYIGVPLIAKGQVIGVLEIFHRQNLKQDEDWLYFLDMLANQTAIAIDNARLFEGMQNANIVLRKSYDETILGWSKAMDLRDKETEGHTQRVTEMTLRLANALGIKAEELVHIRRGALLHDIGKVGVPDAILLKPGPLTEDEWVIMRQHPTKAHDMLSSIAYLRPALDIPYCHHEKWDGTGYPRGLEGEWIPLAARIFAIVDVYDALTSNRPYRKAWPEDEARKYIREQSGVHFDPRIVDAFLRMIP